MNVPTQIVSALALAGVGALFPLASQYHETMELRERLARRTAAENAPAVVTVEPAAKNPERAPADLEAAETERIPAGSSAAEAAETVNMIAALGGDMLSMRRMSDLVERVLALPASHVEEALGAMKGSKNIVVSALLHSALFSRWGELDPDAARARLQEAGGLGNPMFQAIASVSLAPGWLEKDPNGFLNWVQSSSDKDDAKDRELKHTLLDAVIHGMGNVDQATVDKLIDAAPAHRRPWMILEVAEQNSEIDPQAAAERAIAASRAERGEQGAESWIVSRAARLIAEQDPLRAMQFAADRPEGDERNRAYTEVLSAWAGKDKDEALRWFRDQPPEMQRTSASGLREVLGAWSYDEIQRFAGRVDSGTAPALWNHGLSGAAERDPHEALRYLPNMAADTRPDGCRQIASQWIREDPMATSEWIDGMDAGREKDGAISGMISYLGEREPDSAAIWASTMHDEANRGRLTTQHAARWLRRDREAATEWINNTPALNDAQRQQLLTGERRP